MQTAKAVKHTIVNL